VKARYLAVAAAALVVVGLVVSDGAVLAQTVPTSTTQIQPIRPRRFSPAVVRGNHWFVRTSQDSGAATLDFFYGDVGDDKLLCDWDGDGVRSPGVRRGITFFLRDAVIENGKGGGSDRANLLFGNPDDIPICGDWDADGDETIGVVRREGGTLHWFMHNSNIPGERVNSPVFFYGEATDTPIVGDWDDKAGSNPAVRRGIFFFYRESNDTGPATGSFPFGDVRDQPVAGDWDRVLGDTFGVMRNGTWYLRNDLTAGNPSMPPFGFGDPGDKALVYMDTL
jgi:hypothetical protein